MAIIAEYLTINIAVKSLAASMPQFKALGLEAHPPAPWPDPPIQMTDVTFEVPPSGMFSLIEPWENQGPVAKFIGKRGPGVYSIAVRVTDLHEAMRDWTRDAGFEWVLDEPAEVPGGRAGRYKADKVTVNWVRPSTFGGVLLEVFEFHGDVSIYSEETLNSEPDNGENTSA